MSVTELPFTRVTEAEWRHVVDTNLTGSFLCAQAAFALMVRQDPRAWQSYLKEKADTAMAKQTGIAIMAPIPCGAISRPADNALCPRTIW